MAKKRSKFWKTIRISGLFIRELIGWALTLAGLVVAWGCLPFLNNGQVIEGFTVAIVGLAFFRGGLQLVKVSVAARSMRVIQPGPYETKVGEYTTA